MRTLGSNDLDGGGTPMGVPEVPGYERLDLVGAGGYGTVYRAVQTRLDRRVALKTLTVDAPDLAARDALVREARIAASVSEHPHIVTVHDVTFADDGQLCIVMEWYSGGSLADEIAASGPLPVERVLDVGIKIASALDAAHHGGVVHRDIKPGNILLSEYGQPAITDFGTAKLHDEMTTSEALRSFTLHYAAPEVLDDGPVGEAADLYSLSATLYHALSGRRPFDTEHPLTIERLVARIVSSEPPPLSTFGVDERLSDLVAAGLAKDPGDRPSSAREVADALQAIQAALGHNATPVVSAAAVSAMAALANDDPTDDPDLARTVVVDPKPAATGRRPRRSRVAVVAAVVVATLAIGTGAAVAFGAPALLPGGGGSATDGVDSAVAAATGERDGDGDGVELVGLGGQDRPPAASADGGDDQRPAGVGDGRAADATAEGRPVADGGAGLAPLSSPDGPPAVAADGDTTRSGAEPSGPAVGAVDPAPGTEGSGSGSPPSPGPTATIAPGAPATSAAPTPAPTTRPTTTTRPPATTVTTSGSIDCSQWYQPTASEEVAAYQATSTAAVAVHRAPSSSAACDRGVVLPAGATVTVHAVRGSWRYTYDALTNDWGWVPASAFSASNPTPTVPTIDCSEWYLPVRSEQVSAYGATVVSDYRVRRAPDPDPACERGVVVRAGAEITVHAHRGGWRYTYDPATDDWGWIAASAIG